MALLYIAIFVLIAVFFVVTLLYGTKEKSFEQALEEQRSKSNYDLLISSNSGMGKSDPLSNHHHHHQQHKKEMKKDKSKKLKESSTSSTNAKKSKETSASSTKPSEKHVTNVPIKPVVVAASTKLPEMVANVKKDIIESDSVDSEPKPTTKQSKSASVKQHSKNASKIASQLPTQQPSAKEKNSKQPREQMVEEKIVPTITVQVEQAQSQPSSPQVSVSNKPTKKSKRSTSKVNQELSFEDMLELVNSSYFSNDDVTRLTDALLNRQAEENNAGDYNWHKKNDPVEALQKQLTEKILMIDQQAKNIEAIKKKNDQLNQELLISRKKFSRNEIELDATRKSLDCQRLAYHNQVHEIETKWQQKLDQRLVEIRNEERNRSVVELNALKSEIARLNDVINAQQSEQANDLDELEQLRQQLKDDNHKFLKEIDECKKRYENLEKKFNAAEDEHKQKLFDLHEKNKELQKNNDLQMQAVQRNEVNAAEIESYLAQINALKTELDEKISANVELDRLVAELRSKLVNNEKSNSSSMKEFDALQSKLEQIESDNNDLRKRLDSLTSEKNSLATKSDELNNLIKTNDHTIEMLRNALNKLGLSVESSDNLQSHIDALKAKLSQCDELSTTCAELNDLYEQVNGQNEVLKSQVDSLKQENKCEVQKSQEYANTLLETEKILNDLQEKIIKNKSEQNKKLEEFEQILAEKNDENDGMKDELNKQRECLENLNKLNESMSEQVKELKELVANKESELNGFKFKEQNLHADMEKILEENKNLNTKIIKLNNLAQIANHSFQEEAAKVQNLESLLNGKENSNGNGTPEITVLTTSNGNTSN
ncbi:hypothetical protein RDWZM_009401 [Blomia tropicalis]|uniref:Uncharacterized protein n=1 Tax=Blomia tropicalis TaxID=40697 RepID=A0A9Q0RKZ5_BLOTA|nr:hypothetical protein RDWZM_009401 [Blomia tropicalis]